MRPPLPAVDVVSLVAQVGGRHPGVEIVRPTGASRRPAVTHRLGRESLMCPPSPAARALRSQGCLRYTAPARARRCCAQASTGPVAGPAHEHGPTANSVPAACRARVSGWARMAPIGARSSEVVAESALSAMNFSHSAERMSPAGLACKAVARPQALKEAAITGSPLPASATMTFNPPGLRTTPGRSITAET